ncbi:kinase-like domain-containing protein [Lipomyces japonicus]|uniref:kinase-like domain-containing protein n=1 Tax=Lipomyces japonicus TaxID=56871 RepID=UPI0034CDCAA9
MSLSRIVADIAYSLSSCVGCFASNTLYINNRSYRILRLLGEGGFSYVYLVEAQNGELFALKKIRCSFGAESLQNAMKEIESYKIFNDEHIINLIDSNVVQERDGSKTVYILLPYFRKGNLQDVINLNLIKQTHYDEKEALELFLEIANGVRVMHKHRANQDYQSRLQNPNQDVVFDSEAELPLIHNTINDSSTLPLSSSPSSSNQIVAYAHRDIKPANIMISQTELPVLMDLGSCTKARISITSRHQALELQDVAAEVCTMPYRAPELFDVKTNTTIDEGVDIWSLGCTFFALLYSASPFELQTTESGASLSLAIINGQYKFPDYPKYSQFTKDIIKSCLTVEPKDRPDIDFIIERIKVSLNQQVHSAQQQ